MGRLSASLLALLLAAAATVALASCGSSNSGLLPGATASEINSNLDKVQELVAEGECDGANEASAEISGQVEALEGVDSKLKEALSEGATHLAEVVSTCEEAPSEADEELEAQEAEEEGARAAEEAEEKSEKKEKKDKSAKPKEEKEQEKPQFEPPEEKEEENVKPPTEENGGTNSGGVGPGAPVGGE